MKNVLVGVFIVTVAGCSAKPTSSGQMEGEQQSNNSSEATLERTLVGTWIDQEDIKWAFTESGFYADFHWLEPEGGRNYDMYNQSNGTYVIAGDRLIVKWKWALAINRMNPDLANQIIQLTWLDDNTIELKALGKGWWGGADDWRDEIAVLRRQSRDVSSSDKSWINKTSR